MYCIPPWVPSLDMCLVKAPHPITFSFCTISASQMPRARTVVFRSWLFDDKSTGVLVFTTDRRSEKISDLKTNNGKYEACFYFNDQNHHSKQFRLSGFAQVLHPKYGIYPTMNNSSQISAPFSKYGSSNQNNTRQPSNVASEPNEQDETKFSQYPLYSPKLLKLYKEHQKEHIATAPHYPHHQSSGSTSSLLSYPPPGPSIEEWDQEYSRIWDSMSPKAKASFRRPDPGSTLTEDHRRHLDKISRGVDGTGDEAGLDNFAVIVMFVNSADLFFDNLNRRSKCFRVEEDEWIEEEVCP